MDLYGLTAGDFHSCAWTAAGAAYCWGYGPGTGGPGNVSRPRRVTYSTFGNSFELLGAGGYHTCGIEKGGSRLACWGLGGEGQLGEGNQFSSSVPLLVSGSYGGVSGGTQHTCAATTAGGVKCWGRNSLGQVGNGSFSTYVLSPSDVVLHLRLEGLGWHAPRFAWVPLWGRGTRNAGRQACAELPSRRTSRSMPKWSPDATSTLLSTRCGRADIDVAVRIAAAPRRAAGSGIARV
jgi:hypothetical protein